MAIIYPTTHFIAFETRGKIGKPYKYGLRRYGQFLYGQKQPKWGIYQIRTRGGHRTHVQMIHYKPTNPQTETQQANRQKYADGVAAWQSLTDEQKSVYNSKAKSKRMSGYNLFLREYLLSV